MSAVGSRVTGVEVGAVLAFLASRVLGQYELFLPPDPTGQAATGRLTLVAPNIVHAELELNVNPRDFRLWVCLHEETHRVQFTGVPWLREHRSELRSSSRHRLDPAASSAGCGRRPDAVARSVKAAKHHRVSRRPSSGSSSTGSPR